MAKEKFIEQPIEQEKNQERFEDLVIFTSTLYGNDEISKVRGKLALKFFENANKLGVKCVASDGGSNKEFLEEAKKFPNVKILSEPSGTSMGEGRRSALKEALENSNAYFFLWTEPEKDNLVTQESLKRMIAGLREDKTDIVVPRRESKETMPKFQAWIENRANKQAMKITGISIDEAKIVYDFWFGPRMFNREGAQYFLDYKSKLDKWDCVLGPVLNAYKDGKRVSSVDVDYKYDITQKEIEEENRSMKNKRIIQYMTILAAIGDEFWQKKEQEKEDKE